MKFDFNKVKRDEIPADTLISFKWRVIQQLFESKGPQIQFLLDNLRNFIAEIKLETKAIKLGPDGKPKFLRKCKACRKKITSDDICPENSDPEDQSHQSDEDQGLDITEFTRLFNRIGLDDQTLISKVFWIFDEDGSGDVDHKEMAIGLEMIGKSTYEEKIGKFFDLCDDDHSGSIDRKEFYSLLKLNLNDYEDIKRLKSYVKEIFKEFDVDGDGQLDR